jgi:hypothetical protein
MRAVMSLRHWSNRRHGIETRRAAAPLPRTTRSSLGLGQRARGAALRHRQPYQPPEDWHEPSPSGCRGYRIVVREAGAGYRHVVTPAEVRDRLAEFPPRLLERLEVVQLSRMTRKKRSFPCYGMQWGSAVYLYPVEANLVECFDRPPRPAEYQEARLYGGRWLQQGRHWRLIWSRTAIRDFYLNNVLIHELGHLLDDRNTNPRDRERYAEWFAIRFGDRSRRRR